MIFICLYYFFLGFDFITLMQRVAKQYHRPLASFSTMKFTDYRVSQPQPQPQPQPQQPVVVVEKQQQKLKITIKKKKHTPETVTPVTPDTPDTPDTPVEKQKLKITIVKRKPSLTKNKNPTKKIKIIKKQPKQKKEQQQCFDIAPPVTMFYRPYSDYIAPPPKCCRFFIENRHCFLRSTDNACIDPITKNVFGFWNCKIGKDCELLPPADEDDVQDDENDDIADILQLELDNSDDDDYNKTIALALRKKSDANRARLAGEPVAILRHKIAMQYGMHSFNSLGNRL